MARKKDREAEVTGFEGGEQRARLTPVDVQQKVFRLAFRGYNERDVDEFLDKVTEDLAALHEENKRLREQVGERGGAGVEGAQRQAEEIVRQAREHAARLVADAERQGGSADQAGVPSSFLLREREFLQRLASTVQDHARWLKEEARRGRETPAPAPERPKQQKATKQKAGGAPAPAETPPAATERPPEQRQARAAAATAGAAGAASAAAAAAPAQDPVAASVDEPTASWTPTQDAMGEGDWAPEGGQQGPDPLLSAWESAFTEGGSDQARREGEGEPSLRELFWGEE